MPPDEVDAGVAADLAFVDEFEEGPEEPTKPPRSVGGDEVENLLRSDSVLMTVFAQDPSVGHGTGGPVLARINVPADRLQRGPRSHRFHVVDISATTGEAAPPVVLHHAENPWQYIDRWTDVTGDEVAVLATDREFRAQHLFAVASHTLALFERHLGRPIPWRSGYPHLYLVPQARVELNAFYSPVHSAILFGWLPALNDDQRAVHTALSYDVVAHEVTHAILDGLRPRYTEPGLPDHLAFHEALADIVALLSVFDLDGVVEHLLIVDSDHHTAGKIQFPTDPDPNAGPIDADTLNSGRAQFLMDSPLTRLAEQIGGRANTRGDMYPALRRSVTLEPDPNWRNDRTYDEPHRRAEVLVAAVMQTLVQMWTSRIEPFRIDPDGVDLARVAEEGVKSARHLLGMVLRSLDYLPPIEAEFNDVIDTILTADRRLVPDDEHGYRNLLAATFARFGIVPPDHHIVDQDGVVASVPAADGSAADSPPLADCPHDPDAGPNLGMRYEHLNLVAMRTSPDEVYQFIWSNTERLGIDVRFTTRVERVLTATRVGPDGLIVNEVLADYIQILETVAGKLPPGITKPDDMSDDAAVTLWGGGVLVFDQFGRFRLHQRQPLLDTDRQTRRLRHLFDHHLVDSRGDYGSSDGVPDRRRFALLHVDDAEAYA